MPFSQQMYCSSGWLWKNALCQWATKYLIVQAKLGKLQFFTQLCQWGTKCTVVHSDWQTGAIFGTIFSVVLHLYGSHRVQCTLPWRSVWGWPPVGLVCKCFEVGPSCGGSRCLRLVARPTHWYLRWDSRLIKPRCFLGAWNKWISWPSDPDLFNRTVFTILQFAHK